MVFCEKDKRAYYQIVGKVVGKGASMEEPILQLKQWLWAIPSMRGNRSNKNGL